MAVLADDADGARLLALAQQYNIEIDTAGADGGSYSGINKPMKVADHKDLASYVLTFVHELRHLEQDVTWGIFAQRYRLKPTEHALLTRIIEADAFAFSAAFVHRQLARGTLSGAFCNDRMYMEQNALKKIFGKIAQKKSLQKTSLTTVYQETALDFSRGFISACYDINTLRLCHHIQMYPDDYVSKLPPGAALGRERIEDVFDLGKSLALPGGCGEISLGKMLDSAIAGMRPAAYAVFSKMDKKQAGIQP